MLDNVGTFNAASPIEIRGAAAVAGQTTQGFAPFGAGLQQPVAAGRGLLRPVLPRWLVAHARGRGRAPPARDAPATIASSLSAQELADLLAFVRSIDDDTATMPNATDLFIQQ